MEDLKLLSFSDPFLKKAPAEFDFENDDPIKLKIDLLATMYKSSGVGLSANQVGLDKRVFVIGGQGIEPRIFFNPELVSVGSDQKVMKEGCLSYPGLWLMVKRPTSVMIKYKDENGKDVLEQFDGIAARIILHEYDHMIGYNFTMRASGFKLTRATKNLDKKVKKWRIRNTKGRF